MRTALIVTVTEGVEFQPQAAFCASALRRIGFEPKVLPTDFCTSREAFQTALRSHDPAAIVFIDALEWREILVTLSRCAREAGTAPIVILGSAPGPPAAGDFDRGVAYVHDDGAGGLGRALGADGSGIDAREIPLDYAVYGGPSVLRRAMAASLFGDLGTIGLVAARRSVASCSPTAMLARLEGPVAGPGITLAPAACVSPIDQMGGAVRMVEWWDRSISDSSAEVLGEVAALGLRQTVRLLLGDVGEERLRDLHRLGVSRVVLECDALADAAELRVPGAAGTEAEVATAAEAVRKAGLEVGVLLVIGIPGEGRGAFERRRRALARVRPDRIRVVPFEPAGGTEAHSWCAARELWPPADNRWNRELYQPLRQAESREYAEVLDSALGLLAECQG